MTPRGTHVFVRWCVTLCILTVVLLAPTRGFAFTAQEPPSPAPSPSPSPPPSVDREVTLGRDRGPPGTEVTVQGSGYGACGDSVDLAFDDLGSKNANVDRKGKFKADLTVPKNAKPGPLMIKVSDDCTEVTRRFTVLAAITPPPTTRPPPAQPPPTPPTLPAPTPGETTPPSDRFAEKEAIAEQELRPGSILYNPPEQMRVGETERIEVRITRQLSTEIYEDLKGRGDPRVEKSPITADMKVELIGNPEVFDIRPMSSPIQSVFGNYTEWYWDVTPLSSGIQSLSIKATFLYQGQTFKDLPPFERRIEVAVNPVYSTSKWLGDNWDKLLAVLGIPSVFAIGTTLYKRRRRRLMSSSGGSGMPTNSGE